MHITPRKHPPTSTSCSTACRAFSMQHAHTQHTHSNTTSEWLLHDTRAPSVGLDITATCACKHSFDISTMRRVFLLLLRFLLTFGASLQVAGYATMDRPERTATCKHERNHNHNSRTLLMQGRTAADEWEASSRNGILDSGTMGEETGDDAAREGPHPLRTQDWKLEASTSRKGTLYE